MVKFIFFLVILAQMLAFWEIQIEGVSGWAEKLPCWRKTDGWIVRIMGGRPLTGYHALMNLFLITLFHFPAFFIGWTWQLESIVLGSFLGMLTLEDFFWFLFNPEYGLKKFRKGEIWWHPNWWGPVPDFYWVSITISGVLIYLGRTVIF